VRGTLFIVAAPSGAGKSSIVNAVLASTPGIALSISYTSRAPRPGERVADFFCGLGNFTLAIARSGAEVIGVEGSAELARRAQENAAANGLERSARFRTMNLFELDEASVRDLGRLDRALIDPPREGAIALAKALAAPRPARIVYVSCSAATLARDAGALVHSLGYTLSATGVVNMFPHTSHVESIAVFDG